MRSIKTKLIALYAAVVLVVMIVSGTIMLWDMRSMEIDRTEAQLRSLALSIYGQIIQPYGREGFITADAWGVIGLDEYTMQGVILNEIGNTIAPEAFIGLRFTDSAVTAAVAGQEGLSVGRPGPNIAGGADHQQWISFAMPVTSGGEDFIVYTRISTHFMNEQLSRIALTLGIMVVVSLVLTLSLWFFLANTLTGPIISLTRHTKAIAEGDFSHEIVAKSNDEIGQLTYNFNYMAKELGRTLSSMASERNQREAILQNTSHGVLGYDARGNLTHANNAAAELLPKINLQNYSLQDLLTFLGICPDEIQNLQPEEVREYTYQDGDYFISAYVTAYASNSTAIDGYVLVLQDASRQVKLENMRKEFVANVSHELRTPLTSIRTYTETLIDGAMEDREMATNFLKVIDEEANRMTLLVSDLLELSRIDSKQAVLEMDVVDLLALLRLTARQSQFLAASKSQVIEIDAQPQPCFVEGNASRINQVISNIISNAIKYSPENTLIKVTMQTTDEHYKISVADQGMGIPQESLARIFERFYRVDKARARAMGGTGLGLAIVKEIMEEHGGTVNVISEMGKGTTMVLTFNRYRA